MRFRGKSIRRKIVALLLVPLLSLGAVWAYATVISGQEAYQVLGVSELLDRGARPVQEATRALQHERLRTLVYLADPRGADVLEALRRSRTGTDTALAKVEEVARDRGLRERMNPTSRSELTDLVDGFKDLESIRSTVEDNRVSRTTALDLYTRLINPCFGFLTDLRSVKDVALDKYGRGVVGIDRARELLSREDAVVTAALTQERLGREEIQSVSDLVAQRDLVYETNLALLPESERKEFTAYWSGGRTSALRDAEYGVSQSVPSAPSSVSARMWSEASGTVLDTLAARNDRAETRYRDKISPYAHGVLLRATLAGVLGLLALLLSVYLSLRIGRSLVRDLSGLRRQAHEAAGVRLPAVMRRLAAGEEIDVETETPRLTYEKDEMGQVGQALNTLQRAAVEAAVRQAELRQGVSEVFVNLARRSQVLLHKQLTLLDAMERRTEDTDELADLFRLDHLTTRMRRHAEGLVILSGAAPSRQWRRPVPLMDVVRAAVSEVEDYERVEVRRLPRIAVTGPTVGDLTHLLAELLENATVFSPPHTAVQVLGEHVGNGFTLEIHDRGLGMAPEAMLDANQRLAETPEFELSDTDRLGLFVVSRLARRRGVRVSLQPSPYGGTTAVVFLPEALLTEAGDTDGAGLRIGDLPPSREEKGLPRRTTRKGAGTQEPGRVPAAAHAVLDGPVELEAPLGVTGLDAPHEPDETDDDGTEHGGLFRARGNGRGPAGDNGGEQHQQARDERETAIAGATEGGDRPRGPLTDLGALPRRPVPKLVSSHGRPVRGESPDGAAEAERARTGTASPGAARPEPSPEASSAPSSAPDRASATSPAPDRAPASAPTTAPGRPPAGPGGLPRRVRQASLARQLREEPPPAPAASSTAQNAERDADEVRERMAALQQGWQRGRVETGEEPGGTAKDTTAGSRPAGQNAGRAGATGPASDSTAPRTTPERDGR
ncbi:nitrate- and nitrite sensing domain-containing protein [Streptomyces sp. NPDC049954]|uniref:nitrate- and nitrite sensing domain-containing protein n=1 Tax=Streptomyces sp. NPDC049954 TaxID=3155779 RepID=UPI003432099F